MSTAYCRRRSRRATHPPGYPRGTRTNLSTPWGQGELRGGRQGQGNRTGSARPLRAASQRKRKRSEYPLNDSARLTRVYTGGGGEEPPTQQRALPTCSQGMEGHKPIRQQDPPARSQGTEEGGNPLRSNMRYPCTTCKRVRGRGGHPRIGRGGDGTPRTATRATCARHTGERGGGNPLPREERRGGRRKSIKTGKQTQVRTDGTGKKRRRTAPIRGEGDARGAGAEYSISYT